VGCHCPPCCVNSSDTWQKLPELDAVLALCKAAPFVESSAIADQLLTRLAPYLPESFAQRLAPSPQLRDIDPSPYEVLTHHLTSAILSLGARHPLLRPRVLEVLTHYVKGWSAAALQLSSGSFDDDHHVDFAADGELGRIMTQSMSLLGFLDAAAEHFTFWSPYDQLRFVDTVQTALSEKFLIAFETALSIVRNARSRQHGLSYWKQFAKHYAAIGRPLGATVLHDSFLKVVVACASGLVQAPHRELDTNVLEALRISHNSSNILRDASTDALAEGLTRIAVEEMDRLDNDLDYLQRVGSAWQQRQASAVKAKVITTCVCCAVYDEDTTDSDLLISWLDNALNDPAQAADLNLASTVLKSMSILAKLSPAIASSLGRSLPRVIVQGGFDHETASVAAQSLASVLSLLPQDAVITTLYSLGNVISTGPVGDRTSTATTMTNGQGKTSRATDLYSHQHEGSAISLTPSDVEAPNHVHTTVIETIVSVARQSKDDKITALALSMLVQKVGWISKVVDAKIITESALLGIYSGPGEFRSLLKLYSKLCHDALLKDDRFTLEAVSCFTQVRACHANTV
jgi:phosphatidylinositol 4-kinase